MSRSVANPSRHRSLSLGTEQNRRFTTQTLPTERKRHGHRPESLSGTTKRHHSSGAAPNRISVFSSNVRVESVGREHSIAGVQRGAMRVRILAVGEPGHDRHTGRREPPATTVAFA